MAKELNTIQARLEQDTIDRLPSLLRDRLGLSVAASPSRAREFDLALTIKSGHGPERLYVEVETRVLGVTIDQFAARAEDLRQRDPRAIPLLVTPTLTPRARSVLRERRLNHADFTGTVFIRAEGLIVDIDGEPDMAVPIAPSRINPFADKASIVIRTFLAEPNLPLRVTDVARRADVTKGWVSLVATELEARGYLVQTGAQYRLADPVRVLHDWSTQYAWRDNRVTSFVAGYSYREVLDLLPKVLERFPDSAALTLLAGAELLAPHVAHEQIHLYVRSRHVPEVRDRIRQTLFLEPTEAGGTVHLVEPYYAQSAFFDKRVVHQLPVVSPVQLYLDLLQYPLRGREAASMIARTTLAHDLSLSADQVRELA